MKVNVALPSFVRELDSRMVVSGMLVSICHSIVSGVESNVAGGVDCAHCKSVIAGAQFCERP